MCTVPFFKALWEGEGFSVENLLLILTLIIPLEGSWYPHRGLDSVVLMVVDASDFDGSFPKKVANLVSIQLKSIQRLGSWGSRGNVPRVVLVVTKLIYYRALYHRRDSSTRVRQRAREGGSNKLTSVHLVRSCEGLGLKNLVDDVIALVGQRGNVWAIGAENLWEEYSINSLGKHVGGRFLT
uniref:Uncharacterized protein n=1 Tax=Cannabis sativa TaxID=3483 RepID=A0A803R4M1_CANSA